MKLPLHWLASHQLLRIILSSLELSFVPDSLSQYSTFQSRSLNNWIYEIDITGRIRLVELIATGNIAPDYVIVLDAGSNCQNQMEKFEKYWSEGFKWHTLQIGFKTFLQRRDFLEGSWPKKLVKCSYYKNCSEQQFCAIPTRWKWA